MRKSGKGGMLLSCLQLLRRGPESVQKRRCSCSRSFSRYLSRRSQCCRRRHRWRRSRWCQHHRWRWHQPQRQPWSRWSRWGRAARCRPPPRGTRSGSPGEGFGGWQEGKQHRLSTRGHAAGKLSISAHALCCHLPPAMRRHAPAERAPAPSTETHRAVGPHLGILALQGQLDLGGHGHRLAPGGREEEG